MDPTKFDELTKTLATPTSRRQALKTLAATATGGILGLGGIGEALSGKCKSTDKHCKSIAECCTG